MFEKINPALAVAILDKLAMGACNSGSAIIKEAIFRAMTEVLSTPEFTNIGKMELTRSEQRLILEGKKIPAIKSVRERTGLSLKEAKDLCDAWQLDVVPTKPASYSPLDALNEHGK